MKYIALIMLLLVPSMAQAQTPVSKETANTYFSNCVARTAPTHQFTQSGQEMLCACTAARLTQFFTMEDMQKMMAPDPAVARPAYNKMTINVYAPCMEEPVREYHYNACISNPNLAGKGNMDSICRCAADEMAFYMKNYGSSLFARILSQNPNVADPNDALFSDPDFQKVAAQKTMGCLK